MQKSIITIENGQYVTLVPITGRTVSLSSVQIYPQKYYFEDNLSNIQTVRYGNSQPITVGNQIYLRDAPFRIEYIEESGDSFFLHCCRQSPSSYFFMPVLGETRDSFLWDSFFINSFMTIEDTSLRKEGNYIHLLYRFSKGKKYTNFEERIKSHPLFRGFEDPDPFHVLFYFEIPEEYTSDYELFIKGKYSRLSNNFKSEILSFHKAKKKSDLFKILHRDPSMKSKLEKDYESSLPVDAELYHRPEWKNETYFNRYKITKSIQRNEEYDKEHVQE